MKSINILKEGETLQFQLTTIQTPNGNTIKWESYQRKHLHIPDFLRIIIKSKDRILIEKSFRPIIDQYCYGFISLLNTIDLPSDDQILSQIENELELKKTDIISFKCHRFNHYANPDECNSSQWLCICEVDDIEKVVSIVNQNDIQSSRKELNDNQYEIIDITNKQKVEEFMNDSKCIFDEECYTFLFSFLYLQF